MSRRYMFTKLPMDSIKDPLNLVECDACGAAVSNADVHAEWHERNCR